MSIVQETGFSVGTGTSTSVSFSLRNVSQASCTLNIHVSRYYMHLNVIIIIKHMNILYLLSVIIDLHIGRRICSYRLCPSPASWYSSEDISPSQIVSNGIHYPARQRHRGRGANMGGSGGSVVGFGVYHRDGRRFESHLSRYVGT